MDTSGSRANISDFQWFYISSSRFTHTLSSLLSSSSSPLLSIYNVKNYITVTSLSYIVFSTSLDAHWRNIWFCVIRRSVCFLRVWLDYLSSNIIKSTVSSISSSKCLCDADIIVLIFVEARKVNSIGGGGSSLHHFCSKKILGLCGGTATEVFKSPSLGGTTFFFAFFFLNAGSK